MSTKYLKHLGIYSDPKLGLYIPVETSTLAYDWYSITACYQNTRSKCRSGKLVGLTLTIL